jgi:hypothetical protein
MSNDATDGRRSGHLFDAAERFARANGAALADVPFGHDGVRFLDRCLRAYCRRDDTTDADDFRFVEGAGALLGVLLLSHLGGEEETVDGRYVLALGRHGRFDPFRAIEAAIDADDPRASLAGALRAAEAEATATDGMGRTVRLFIERLADAREDLTVTTRRGAVLVLSDGSEVDLSRAADATSGQDERHAEAVVARVVSLLPGHGRTGGEPWSDAAARIVPRLVGSGFDARVSGAAISTSALVGDVRVALVLRYGDRARFVGMEDLRRWERNHADALAVAVENLVRCSTRARFTRTDAADGQPVVRARSGDALDAARLLLPDLGAWIGEGIPEPWLVGVPHRDTMLVCSLRHGAACAWITDHAPDEAARAPHAISPRPLVVDPTHERVFRIAET